MYNVSTHVEKACFKVIVVSDRVFEGTGVDVSGEMAIKLLEGKGYCIGGKEVIANSYREIIRVVRDARERVLVFLGGTGPSPRDITVDVIEDISWRCLPGFGELFRYLSYQRIGARAVLSRASLCVLHSGKIIVALPGSPDAVSLGIELLSQVIDHLTEEVERFDGLHECTGEGK